MTTQIPELTILIDNTAGAGELMPEHGLSILIRVNQKTILLDVGQSNALENNIRKLGIQLSDLDMLVLSHGHYDHTGAVDFVLQENPHVHVFAHPHILKKRYSLYTHQEAKEISMPSEERLLIENLPDTRLQWITQPTAIADAVWLTGPVPRKTSFEDTGGPFFNDPQGREPDLIQDDLSMWIETPKGLLVVCGCCHSGIVNTLNMIQEQASSKKIWCILGGLHLKNASADRLNQTVKMLNKINPEFIVPCHCTGDDAINYFKQHLTMPVHSGFTGFKL